MKKNFPFVGVILNGGRSERMGVNKSGLVLDGVALLESSVRKLREASASSVLIVGNETPEAFNSEGKVVKDSWPDEGPLGGILTALQSLRNKDLPVLIVACDFPELEVTEIQHLVIYAYSHRDSIIVPSVLGRKQWMHACWPVSAEEHLRKAFLKGERAPHRAVSGHKIIVLEREMSSAYFDVDTPEDFEKAKKNKEIRNHNEEK